MGLANGCRLRIPVECQDKDLPALYKGNEQVRTSTPAEKIAWLNMMAQDLRTGVEYTFDPKTGLCRCYRVSHDDNGNRVLEEEIGEPTQYTVTQSMAVGA